MNMRVSAALLGVTLPYDVLDVVMPMHVAVDAEGLVQHVGPTISKVLGEGAIAGLPLLEVFTLHKPPGVTSFKGLMAHAGSRLSLQPRSAPHLTLRGVIMPLPRDGGMILDISLGLSFATAVSDFSLTLHDFSPNDQTIDLLYLHEANLSTARLSRHLSARLQAAHEDAQHQARTDVLTGLNNRRAVDDELEHLLEHSTQEFSLMHLDLDLFKTVNDTYGHAAGDAVLVEIGCILGRELRRTDYPGRVGGDEFLIILRPSMAPQVAGRIAMRLINRIEQPIRIGERTCKVSASIGIVSTMQYRVRPTMERLLADVDGALYQAKKTGKGRYCIAYRGARVHD